VACEKGHDWWVKAASLLYLDTWCRECQRDKRRLGLGEAHKIAGERNGRCLAERYQNSHAAMSWQCDKGHTFERCLQSVKRGAWCPTCHKPSDKPIRRTGFDTALEIAKAAGGKHIGNCQSSAKRTEWQCGKGHVFTATGKTLCRRSYYCPVCEGKGPTTIERIRAVCAGRGGRCLSKEYISLSEPMDFECARGHRWTAKWRNVGGHGSWCPRCARTRGDMTLLTAIAEHYDGEILSSSYLNSRIKYLWRCSNGHRFHAVPSRAKQDWCPECPRQAPSIEKSAHELIAEHWGGECLDSTGGRWACDLGHRFQATLSTAALVWCPTCRNGESAVAHRHYGHERQTTSSTLIPVGAKSLPA